MVIFKWSLNIERTPRYYKVTMEQTLLSDLSPIIVYPFHSSADTIFVQNFIYTIYVQPKKQF